MDDLRQKKLQEEKLLLALNDHWIVVLRYVFVFLCGWLMFISIYFVGGLFEARFPDLFFGLMLFGWIVLMLVMHWFFLQIIQWSLSNWFVTTERIVEFDMKPFTQSDFRTVKISEIHEIEKIKRGVVKNLLDYGEVIINVAAMPTALVFKHLPNPGGFVHLIESIRAGKLKHQPPKTEVDQIRELEAKNILNNL